MRSARLLLLLAALAIPCLPTKAQTTSFYSDRALAPQSIVGSPVPVATPIGYGSVRVCSLPLTQQQPCLPLASITDINGNPISNSIGGNFGQVTTDVTGRFNFGCAPGFNLQIQVQQSASNTPALNYPITCPGGSPGVSSFSYAQTGMDQLDLPTVTNPTTTPQLTLTAQPTQPGFALMGPVPTSSGSNPSFESSAVNSATGSSTPTIAATPITSTSSAVMAIFCADGTHASAPSPGSWTTIDNSASIINGAIYAQNLVTGARITPSTACNSSTTWVDSLGFFGGSFSSVPHSSTLNTSCGTACVQGTLGPLTSGNLVLVVIEWSSASVNETYTVSDNAGNTYVKVASAYQTAASGIGHAIYVAQFVGAATPTISVQANPASVTPNARAYEISGFTSYYSGATGPWTFRAITPSDLGQTQLLWANLLPGTNNSSGTFTQQNGTMDFSGSAALKVPVFSGAAPTTDGSAANNSSTHALNFGSNGTTVNVAAASTGAAGTGTTCAAGAAITAISTSAAPTCTSLIGSGTNGAPVQVFSATTLGADVSVSATTATTVMTRAVTMPSSGCPCRALINYSLYITTASSGVGYSAWVNDGSVNMAGTNAGQSNGSSGALTSLSYGGFSTVTYSNGANVTFTLTTEGDHTYTVKAASQLAGSAPNSSFQIAIVPSN